MPTPKIALTVLAFMLPGTCFGQLVIAHRGASHVAPENTLAAFQQAWAEGADGIEGDFYLSADGEIVCIHDANTKRTTGQDLVVGEVSLDRLRQLDAGSWKDEKYAGEKIPTFAEVAKTVPSGKWFFIELKVGPEIVAPLREAIDKSNLDPKRTIIICFKAETLAECKKRLPGFQTQWLSGFKRPEGDADWLRATPTAEQVAASAQATGARSAGLNGNREVVDEEFVRALRDKGMKAFGVWTVDDTGVALHFARLGAFAITTNRPGHIRSALAEPLRHNAKE